jgi:signal transduction histidine kinase
MQGGRIWVESKVGEGSRFQFVLPGAPLNDRRLEEIAGA